MTPHQSTILPQTNMPLASHRPDANEQTPELLAGLVHLMLRLHSKPVFLIQTLAGKISPLSSLAASALLLHPPAPITTASAVGRSQAVSILAQLTLLHSGMSPAKRLQLFSSLLHLKLPHPRAVTKAAKPDHQVQVLNMLHQLLLSQLQAAISAAELRPACLWTQGSAWLTLRV